MISVSAISCVGDYRLRATFSDGSSGEYDCAALVMHPGPMAQPLRDPAYFCRVFLDEGAPTWPNGYDMAPEWLQREMIAAGKLMPAAAE